MKKNQAGFTLIELLVATTIMIILMAVGLVSFASSAKSARNSKRKADLETVRQAMVLYRSDNGVYPTGDYDNITATLAAANFLSYPIPRDPKDGVADYGYTRSDTGSTTTFCLCALTEGDNQGNSSSASCNFGVGDYFCVENP